MNSYAFLSGERFRLRRRMSEKEAERGYYRRLIEGAKSPFWKVIYWWQVMSIGRDINQLRRKYRAVSDEWKKIRDEFSSSY